MFISFFVIVREFLRFYTLIVILKKTHDILDQFFKQIFLIREILKYYQICHGFHFYLKLHKTLKVKKSHIFKILMICARNYHFTNYRLYTAHSKQYDLQKIFKFQSYLVVITNALCILNPSLEID